MEDPGIKLEDVKIEDLGRVKKVVINKESTTLIEAGGTVAAIEGRVKQIRAQIEETRSDYDREKFQERLAGLVGGVAVIKVGGGTESEEKTEKTLVERALRTIRVAVEEGVVAGGGVALLRAAQVLSLRDINDADHMGVDVVRRACEAPIRQIVHNAGFDPDVVIGEVLKVADTGYGFNAETGICEDVFVTGVVDASKVVSSALKAASSIASDLLMTDAALPASQAHSAPPSAAGNTPPASSAPPT